MARRVLRAGVGQGMGGGVSVAGRASGPWSGSGGPRDACGYWGVEAGGSEGCQGVGRDRRESSSNWRASHIGSLETAGAEATFTISPFAPRA